VCVRLNKDIEGRLGPVFIFSFAASARREIELFVYTLSPAAAAAAAVARPSCVCVCVYGGASCTVIWENFRAAEKDAPVCIHTHVHLCHL